MLKIYRNCTLFKVNTISMERRIFLVSLAWIILKELIMQMPSFKYSMLSSLLENFSYWKMLSRILYFRSFLFSLRNYGIGSNLKGRLVHIKLCKLSHKNQINYTKLVRKVIHVTFWSGWLIIYQRVSKKKRKVSIYYNCSKAILKLPILKGLRILPNTKTFPLRYKLKNSQ